MGCVLNQLARERRAIIVPPSGVDPILFLRKYESVMPWSSLTERVRMIVFEQLHGLVVPEKNSEDSVVRQLTTDDPQQLMANIFRVWGGAKKRSKDGGVIGFIDMSQFETTFATKMDYLTELTAISISRLSLLRDSIIFVTREASTPSNKRYNPSATCT